MRLSFKGHNSCNKRPKRACSALLGSGCHVVGLTGDKGGIIAQAHPYIISAKFLVKFWPAASEEKMFENQPIRIIHLAAILLFNLNENLYICWEPSLSHSCNVWWKSIHYFKKKNFGIRPIRIITVGGYLVCWMRTKSGIFVQDHPYIIPNKFGWILLWSFIGKDFWKSANQNLELALVAILFIQPKQKEIFCEGPPIHHFCKVWLHLAQQLQRRRCLKICQSELSIWRPSCCSIGRKIEIFAEDHP